MNDRFASMDYPLISVVIPAFNSERHLAEAIHSVISQNYSPVEIIVIDDGSADRTREVAATFGSAVRYVHQPNEGIGSARNRGMQEAGGSVLAFLDSDDVWTPNKLERRLRLLQSRPENEVVFGLVQQFADRDDGPVEIGEPAVWYAASMMIIKRDSFARVGPFRTDVRVGEYIDWYTRASEAGLCAQVLPELVLRRRIHEENTGIRQRASSSDYPRVLKEALDRRRRGKI
jgi:glycosyltransferase involved in cell wall biosynthesis